MKRDIFRLFGLVLYLVVIAQAAAAQETPIETPPPAPLRMPSWTLTPGRSFALTQTPPATPTQPAGIPSTALQKGVGWGIAVGMALQGGDAMQTAFCLGSQQCKEGNPVLAPFEDHPFWFGFTKLGIASAVSYAALRLRKPHPYWALLIVGMEIGLETYAVIHNNALFPPSEANATAMTRRR